MLRKASPDRSVGDSPDAERECVCRQASTLRLVKLDLANDCVTVRNEGRAAVPLTGWQLHSLTGGQHFAFPDGTTLAAGATVSVWSGRQGQQRQQAAEDDDDDEGEHLFWTRTSVWNDDGDAVSLRSAADVEVDRRDAKPQFVVRR